MNFICLFVLVYILQYKLLILSCYAVVNLLLLPSTDGAQLVALSGWWAQWRYRSFGCSATKCFSSFFALRLCRRWWAQMDSDHRPHAYQACALTSWAMSPYVVEVIGFEPMTPCLQGRCSTSWAIPPFPKITLPVLSGSLLFIKNE